MNPSTVETDVQSGQVAMRRIISFKHSATCELVLPISTRYVQTHLLLKNTIDFQLNLVYISENGALIISLYSLVYGLL